MLTGKYTRGENKEMDSKRAGGNEARGRTSERALEIARAVDEVADDLGASSAQVATAWVQAQGYRYIPIVGARKVSQIQDSLKAATLVLGEEHLERLNQVSAIELGFPHDFLESKGVLDLVRSEQRHLIDGRTAKG